MKKVILLLFLTLSFGLTSLAGGNVSVRGYRVKSGSSNPIRDRLPMDVPIEITYDSACKVLLIEGPEDLECEIFVYDATGNLENYSPFLNVTFPVSSSPYHTIFIQGDDWYAEAEF